MIKKTFLLFSIVLFFSGCSQCIVMKSEYYDITGKVLEPKPSSQDIEIFTNEVPRPYQEIGVVNVLAHLGTTREAINEELKKRARNAGADALMDVRYGEDKTNDFVLCGKVFSTKRNLSAQGKAIIFIQPEQTAADKITPEKTAVNAGN